MKIQVELLDGKVVDVEPVFEWYTLRNILREVMCEDKGDDFLQCLMVKDDYGNKLNHELNVALDLDMCVGELFFDNVPKTILFRVEKLN